MYFVLWQSLWGSSFDAVFAYVEPPRLALMHFDLCLHTLCDVFNVFFVGVESPGE